MTGWTEADFWEDVMGGRWRVAKYRAHVCGNARLVVGHSKRCPRPEGEIPRGERYFDSGEVTQDRWTTMKLCADCAVRPVGP